MKEASRYMPKYNQPKTSFFTALLGLITILIIAFVLFNLISDTPFLGTVFLLIVICIYFQNKKTKKKFALLAEQRKEIGICEFARSFETNKIDTCVIRAVYEQIKNYVPEFPIKAEDDLFEILNIDEEDLESDLLDEIAQRTGRSLENIEKNKYHQEIKQVKDLVYFFNEQPLLDT